MERLLDKSLSENEIESEVNLRPKYLNEYIGQDKTKNNLSVFIGAAIKRNECLDHTLLYGPPGLGKTTLAHIIANEMSTSILVLSGPSIEKPGDLAKVLCNLEPGQVLFIDEIHRIPRIVEEILYQAMEDFELSVLINRDDNTKALTIPLVPFTLVGATTRAGDLTSPLRARFGISEKINFYKVEDIQKIVKRTAEVLSCTIDEDAALEIAKRSRGTPRIANRLFKRVRDFANYNDLHHISITETKKALTALQIDEIGLDEVDRRYLKTIILRFAGGPVGIEAISSAIGEERTNLEDVYEPYLVQIGFIDRTLKGRIATKKAYKHLSIKFSQ